MVVCFIAEAKERAALVSLNAEDVLKVLDNNTELLEVIQDVLMVVERDGKVSNGGSTIAAVRAAIAKATQP